MDDRQPLDIFVVTGELSGDKLGFEILKNLSGKVKMEGVLGPYLKTLEIKELFGMDELNFMGILRPIASLKKIFRAVKKIEKRILEKHPHRVLLIDLPDIHLVLAKRLRKRGYKGTLIQLVCPSIWAWRPKRKAILEKYYDELLCLFPFEEELFKGSSLKVRCVGHPLNTLKPRIKDPKKKILALFPGSRKQEVVSLLPLFLEASRSFSDYAIHVSVAKDSLLSTIEKITKGYAVTLRGPEEKEALLSETSFALSKNGTINLELALLHIPQISCYPLSTLEQLIFQYFFGLTLTHFSLPNILLKKRAVPELIGPFCTLKNIKKELANLLSSPFIATSMEMDYAQLSSHMKEHSKNELSLI
jgi:lipid-A-disaccharide synthase